ncbi:MAG: UDP-N-acetylmuramoyl-L-alanyl-D-glutamate--2,6-diaminopimelate ligase [Bacteroidia bacterium]
MRLLKDILYKAGSVELHGSTNLAILSLTSDSRKVEKNSLFVAVKGIHSDGHDFISMAEEKGAIAIICEQLPSERKGKITYVVVSDSAFALGVVASNFYDNPSSKLKLIGVTGTNGKTTVATLLYQLYTQLGYTSGLISTVRNIIAEEVIPSTHTTPDSVQLQKLLDTMVKAGCSHAFMEVSSHAIDQKRIAGSKFIGGVFTNITRDHLDYHITFENYFKAKQQFFNTLGEDAFSLVNIDDPNGSGMSENTRSKIKTYALSQAADFRCKIMEKDFGGMLMRMDDKELWTPLIGTFNAYNLTAVYATAILLGQDKLRVLTGISKLRSVEGRFEYIKSPGNVTAIVDYAHTPDALENVLETIKEIRTGNEQVITVVGCGGDRDAGKRPEMARIATELSNRVILTSDNPRTENPDEIIKQMQAGVEALHVKKTLSITDRREAIRTACALAQSGDIILIAGKGHEKYQEINGVKHLFDDLREIKETFNLQGS